MGDVEMKIIEGVNSISSITATDALNRAKEMTERATSGAMSTPGDDGPSFADQLRDSLDSVARSQKEAAQLVRDYEVGKETDLAKVMVSQQVSSLGFQLTLNIRNKAMTAYKDIMNMPV
jgi:flagellar hook-basal body complex protein FliE